MTAQTDKAAGNSRDPSAMTPTEKLANDLERLWQADYEMMRGKPWDGMVHDQLIGFLFKHAPDFITALRAVEAIIAMDRRTSGTSSEDHMEFDGPIGTKARAMLALISPQSDRAVTEPSDDIARIISNWRNPRYMKLHAGEMTAQEVRTVRAIVKAVGWEINEILKRATLSPQDGTVPGADIIERCAQIADMRAKTFQSGHGPCSLSLQEECEDIAQAIRKLAQSARRGSADARLIAAAPDMLAALRSALRCISACGEPKESGVETEVLAAIAKATGDTR